MDLGLFQRDIAKQIGVTEDTITNWELGYGEPKIKYYPAIISFLGYLPIEIDTSTLGGRIELYRYRNGLSRRKLAKLLGVWESTVFDWEQCNHIPTPSKLRLLNEYLNQK